MIKAYNLSGINLNFYVSDKEDDNWTLCPPDKYVVLDTLKLKSSSLSYKFYCQKEGGGRSDKFHVTFTGDIEEIYVFRAKEQKFTEIVGYPITYANNDGCYYYKEGYSLNNSDLVSYAEMNKGIGLAYPSGVTVITKELMVSDLIPKITEFKKDVSKDVPPTQPLSKDWLKNITKTPILWTQNIGYKTQTTVSQHRYYFLFVSILVLLIVGTFLAIVFYRKKYGGK